MGAGMSWLNKSAILVLLLAAGCEQIDATGNYARTNTGLVIGNTEYKPITEEDGQIYVPPDFVRVTTRRGRDLYDRYDEQVKFPAGWLRFQRFHADAFAIHVTNAGMIQGILDADWYRERGFPSTPGPLKLASNRYGPYNYVVVDAPQWRCVIFSQYFWLDGASWRQSPGNSELRGAACYKQAEPGFVDAEQATIAALNRVRVGRDVNRPMPASATSAPADAKAAPNYQSGDTAARLRELQKLLDDKLITPDEYASRRRQILESL